MPTLPWQPRFRRSVGHGTASLLVCLLGGSLILSADTTGKLRAATVGTCYCHCAATHAHRGCVKMCELPKYASRRWATTCAKPRLKLPVENRDAGPRFEHPGRSERAQLPKPAEGS
ncbi:MAG: hypothetical protein WA789_08200 [Candidatus Acidiferrum sp.]